MPGSAAFAHGYERYRTASGAVRMMPAFLVIGAQRAGTSSFYWNLVRHPRIRPALEKEVHFFDREENYGKGPAWYRGHFPWRRGAAITGEATPAYLYRTPVPGRVKELLPDVRLIVLLRNPVDRAYSNFQMSRRNGRDPETFERAIRRELDHVGGRRITAENLEDYALLPYLQRGVYVEQLKNWFAHFERSRFRVIDSADFYAGPLAALRETAESFLGLPRWGPRTYWKHPKESVPYPRLAPWLRAELTEFYRPYNEELFTLLGWSRRWDGTVCVGKESP